MQRKKKKKKNDDSDLTLKIFPKFDGICNFGQHLYMFEDILKDSN